MKSNFNLTYVMIDPGNLDFAYQIQKETFPEDPDYEYLYDKVMKARENYTLEDTDTIKNHALIYTYPLSGDLELWNNSWDHEIIMIT